MTESTTPPALPPKAKRKTGLFIAIGAAIVAVVVAAAFILPALLNPSQSEDPGTGEGAEQPAERVSVKLGVADAGKAFWNVLVAEASAEGIDVEIVSFTDYATPNPALSTGEIDINKFQHLRYLAQYNAAQGDDLVALGASEIYPITIYSKRWSSVEEVPAGAEVTLSNNPANQVRPLLALEAAGLIALKGDPGWSATLDDIDYANSRLGKVTPIDPTQTASSLESVDLAFVDTPFATAAGLTDDFVVYTEDPDRADLAQYINIFAVRAEDAANPAYLRIVELYHSPAVHSAIQVEEGFSGVFKPELTQAQLAEVLAAQLLEFSQ